MSTIGTYLDNASTSFPKPDVVWQAAREYLTTVGASPGRGGYRAARRADEIIEAARASIATLFGVSNSSRIVFTSNATHALNIAIQGSVCRGDHVVTTSAEHNSVLRPLEALSRAGEITYTVVEIGADGSYDLDRFAAAMRPRTRLVVVNHASNVTGAVAPAAELAELAHQGGARLLLDTSQTAGFLDIDVSALGVDLLAFTGHKCLGGPPGTGGLYVREPALLHPLMQGGTGVTSHALVHPVAMPAKFEAGTQNYVGIAGLGAAVDLLLADGLASLRARELDLLGYCRTRLEVLDEVTVHDLAPTTIRTPVISLNVDGLYPSELCAVLDERFGVMTRAGLHCAPLIHRSLGTLPHGTVRVSIGSATTSADIDTLTDALTTIITAADVRPGIAA